MKRLVFESKKVRDYIQFGKNYYFFRKSISNGGGAITSDKLNLN